MSTTKALARHLQHLANSQTEEVADAMTRAADLIYEQDSALRTQHALLEKAMGLLEELAVHDNYQTEYDGQMVSVCPECLEQDGSHRDTCAFVRARAFLTAHLEPKP